MTKLPEDLENKIKKYKLSLEDIATSGWRYLGDDRGTYLKISCKDTNRLPAFTDRCLCNHPIKHQCYITNDKDIVVLGNCCIKKWIPKHLRGRTCDLCRKPHKNRKNNLCNDCRAIQPDVRTPRKMCERCLNPHRNRKDNFCNGCREELKQQDRLNEELRQIAYRYCLRFGKYKDHTLEQVYDKDPKYVKWLVDNLNQSDERNQRLFEYIDIIVKDKSN